MRKTLLAGAAAIGFAFTANGALASASSCNNLCDTDRVLAQALGVNIGAAYSLNLIAQDATAAMTGSVQGNQGVTQGNQNAGAGALQQNTTAVAAVQRVNLRNDEVVALAAALNIGAASSFNFLAGAGAGAFMTGSVQGNQGVTQVNQNAGAGALQQNAVALAAVEGCGPDCVDVNLAQTAALSVNFGYVHSLNELCGCDAAQAGMIGSINGNVGLTQVSQNAGAGALQQNAIALGSIRGRN
jgi:hypothetical protein